MNAANILVVDDEPQIRRVLRSTLSTSGYVIMEAKTGEEALEWMRKERKERPDLVLLDVNMMTMSSSLLGLKSFSRAFALPFAAILRATLFLRSSQRI